MVDHAQKVSAVEAYVAAFDKSDADAVAALFAEDAIVEDPIGTPPHRGRAAIREFYANSMKTGAKLKLDAPVRGGANYAAFCFTVTLNFAGGDKKIEVIDTFAFNDEGKVTEMRAFWGPENMHGF
jgi:steroid delta-isomerase